MCYYLCIRIFKSIYQQQCTPMCTAILFKL